MKLSYDPSINKFSVEETDRPYRKVSYADMRLWLRGDGFPPDRIRQLLQLAFVRGRFGLAPLIIS